MRHFLSRFSRLPNGFWGQVKSLDERLGRAAAAHAGALQPDAAQPANDITYLDATARVVRGGDGALFVFRRDVDNGARPLLTAAQRAELFGDACPGEPKELVGGGAAIATAGPAQKKKTGG